MENNQEEEKEGEMTVREAGKRGGKSTSEKHGHEFYEEIGHKGGEKGGEVTSEKYGHEFYEEIGHKGGQKVKELIEEGKKEMGMEDEEEEEEKEQ